MSYLFWQFSVKFIKRQNATGDVFNDFGESTGFTP